MDFRFNINNLLPKRINKITHTLIPEGFKGDRREYNECQRLLTRILDDMGEASAKAQGLNRTITSALKLRDTDHIIYLMIDHEGNNGLGSVVGLLKTGSKTLFMFDENGLHYQLKPRCILDFYIHESRQRMGLGSELYQYMLFEENLKSIKLAIDRPSDKFLSFLMKHYGLTSIIPQNNKFVVFKGFFDDEIQDSQSSNRFNNSSSPNRQSSEIRVQPNNTTDVNSSKNNSINGTPVARSAYGRYAASRPPCSMANIIHNTTVAEQPANNTRSATSAVKMEHQDRPDSLNFSNEKEIIENIQCENVNSREKILISKKATAKGEIHVQDTNSETNSQFEDVSNGVKYSINDTSETISVKKEEINDDNIAGVSSPICCEEVVEGNQQPSTAHLDLKFYHSPLW